MEEMGNSPAFIMHLFAQTMAAAVFLLSRAPGTEQHLPSPQCLDPIWTQRRRQMWIISRIKRHQKKMKKIVKYGLWLAHNSISLVWRCGAFGVCRLWVDFYVYCLRFWHRITNLCRNILCEFIENQEYFIVLNPWRCLELWWKWCRCHCRHPSRWRLYRKLSNNWK